MTPPSDARRSLSDDLLDDLKQGAPRLPVRQAATPEPAFVPSVREPVVTAPQTPTVEVRITPRSWSGASLEPLPDRGLAVRLGPLRVALWRNRH
jgi:hypothetical protein